jgi:hypothetical protein
MVSFPWQKMAKKRRLALSYRAIFEREGLLGEHAKIVLADLATYCRHLSTPVEDVDPSGRIDPLAVAREEGKRSVYIHVAAMLTLSDAEVVEAFRVNQAAIAAEIMSVQRQALQGGSGG